MNEKSIPNFNSVSTLIDRMTIERVKLEQIKLRESNEDNARKAKLQHEIIQALKEEFVNVMLKYWHYGEYMCIIETRTFEFR
jgi:hypothetical protein